MTFSFPANGHVYIIAEIGGNFRTFDEARQLVDAACRCGVDAIKLQTFTAENVASRKALFDMENTGVTSQFELFRQYAIDEELHRQIFDYIRSKGVDWFSTPSHQSDVEMLDRLGVGAYKVGSDDAVNLPFLKYLARREKPIILATGMCTLEEVRESVATILGEGNPQLALLHAVTSYPTHAEDVNLRAMQTMMREFGLPTGYSDHTIGTVACLAAAAMGAVILEKHFTLDKHAEGPDHILSADPAEMTTIVEQVRVLESMLGSGLKMPAAAERGTRINNRKSIVVARDLPQGHCLTADDIAVKRPGYGIPPSSFDQVLGRQLNKSMLADEVVTWGDFR